MTDHPSALVSVPVDLISRALEELRMIRMKDSDAVYDTTLRLDLQIALAAAPAAPQAAGVGEREAFEAWYCADAKASCGLEMEASDIAKLRDGDAYGDRLALNSKWEGWQGRALRAPSREPEVGAVEATGARAVIRNGQIVISIYVDALPLILSGSIALNAVAGTFKVTDAPTFAKEVCRALNAEKEDGTTRVHMMFDSAFNHAIDQGAEGVEEISEDEFEAEASRLQAEAASALATREEAPADHHERNLTMTNDELIEQALSHPPMEAPAEAGEPSLVDWFSQFIERHQEGCGSDTDALIACLDRVRDSYRAHPPAREKAQPVADAVEPIERAVAALKGHIEAIQVAKAGGGSSSVITDCVNGLPEVVRWIEGGLFNVEAAFEQYEDNHPAPDALRVAVKDIAAERQRQVDAEGCSEERDDRYTEGEMARAAVAYALAGSGYDHAAAREMWPARWHFSWWKPTTPRRDLVKAGALAGIDAGEVAPFTRCRQSPNVWACSPAARSTADRAKARAVQLAANGARCTVTDTDRYRRNVARCTVNGRDLGAILVREGLAISETNYGDPYRREERQAREQGRGIWQ